MMLVKQFKTDYHAFLVKFVNLPLFVRVGSTKQFYSGHLKISLTEEAPGWPLCREKSRCLKPRKLQESVPFSCSIHLKFSLHVIRMWPQKWTLRWTLMWGSQRNAMTYQSFYSSKSENLHGSIHRSISMIWALWGKKYTGHFRSFCHHMENGFLLRPIYSVSHPPP